MGNRLNRIRDDHKRRLPDPQTTPTRYDTKFVIVGRSKNGEVKYPLPLNANEKKIWLEDSHRLIRHLWQNNFSSPIEDLLKNGGIRVLDVGCGPGTWVIDMAKDYPKSSFVGIDTEAVFPTNHNIKNLEFQQINLHDLSVPDNTFDLVFVRSLGDSFSTNEWKEKVLPKLIRLTKPGFFLEIFQSEPEFSRCGQNLEKWNRALLNSGNANSSICENFENWLLKSLNENQLSSLRKETALAPIGTWASEMGKLGISHLRQISIKMKPHLIKQLDISSEQYDEMMKAVERECNEHMTYKASYRFIAQKKQ